ncbi:MAG: GNAT family N-acetyltransferase [Halanaerobiales bacterium]|nr:GNAT family N-acetyltransferase [Halanaerobiales bacterium]
MNITLREINSENWRPVIKLKVSPDQEKFVASNIYSIAQSKIEPEWNINAIYNEEKLVGFLMHGISIEGGEFDGYWICRLMIDHQYQGKGYGKAGMIELLKSIKETGHSGDIYISFEPENEVAEKLYSKLGFEDTCKMDDEEKVFCLYAKS